MYVDYNGKHLYLTDRNNKERIPVKVLVGIPGSSRMACVEAIPSYNSQ